MEGLPFALIATVSAVLYKNLNYDNTKIAFYTSLFTLPWSCKLLVSPLLETLASRRSLILFSEATMAILFLLLAYSLLLPGFFYLSIIIFFLLACLAMIHDMNADGFYILQLENKTQAHFIGIRSICYQLGKLFGQGGLIALAGLLFAYKGIINSWQWVFLLVAMLILFLTAYHYFLLPKETMVTPDQKQHSTGAMNSFKQVFKEFILLPHLSALISFALLYEFPETLLIKIFPLFLLDNTTKGGLALSTADVGLIYGTIGTFSLLIGILCSSFILERISLQRCLTPFTFIYVLTSSGYWILSLLTQPSLWLISVIIVLTHLGYGIVNGAYMFYLLQTFTKGSYPMSLYAIATSLMLVSITLGGAISGYLQTLFGYQHFFLLIIILSACLIILAYYNSKVVLRNNS